MIGPRTIGKLYAPKTCFKVIREASKHMKTYGRRERERERNYVVRIHPIAGIEMLSFGAPPDPAPGRDLRVGPSGDV